MTKPSNGTTERVSLLGPRSELTGDFATTEELVILGRLDGRCVRSPNITIGPAAQVRAHIRAGRIRIEGLVIGDVSAEVSAVIEASATVHGNVHSPQITIHEGANVNGAVNQSAVAATGERDPELPELLAANTSR
jgi:cytoskeletal protein CcmA (bactofilin family)